MSGHSSHEVMAIDPEAGSPADVPIETVRSGLESEENLVRTHASKVVAHLADENPEAVIDLRDVLVDALADERTLVIVHSAVALGCIAAEAPERIEPAVGSLVDLLDQDPPIVSTHAAWAVGQCLPDRADLFREELESLVALTVRDHSGTIPEDELRATGPERSQDPAQLFEQEASQRKAQTRVVAANVVAELAAIEPERVGQYVSELVDALDVDSDDVGVLTTVAETIGLVGNHDPDLVAPAVDPLVELLDHYDQPTVSTAIAALRFANDPVAIEPLRAVASDESHDEELREQAWETVDYLEGETGGEDGR